MTAGSPIAAIDRRAPFAAPTDHGKDKLGEAAKVHAANLRPAFAGIDADELRMPDALLDRLALLRSTELAILVTGARRRGAACAAFHRRRRVARVRSSAMSGRWRAANYNERGPLHRRAAAERHAVS